MEWAQWALELTRAIAWPLAVVAVLWWLREPIRERLGNVEKVSALGVDLEMAARQRVEKEVRELGDALAEPAQPTVPAGTDQQAHDHDLASSDDMHADITPAPGPPAPSQPVQPNSLTPQLTNAQRRAIGELIQQAAEWGRVREQAGLSVDGAHLNWRDGLPTLVTPATPRGTSSSAARKRNSVIHATRGAGADAVRRLEAAGRLEARVDELDKERRRAQTGLVSHPAERLVAEQRYREAVDRLKALDPDSPYLP